MNRPEFNNGIPNNPIYWPNGERYPYTNFHNLNLDWVVYQIMVFQKTLETVFDGLLEEANKYADEQVAAAKADLNTRITSEVGTLNNRIDDEVAALEQQIRDSVQDYEAAIQQLRDDLNAYIGQVANDLAAFQQQTGANFAALTKALNDYMAANNLVIEGIQTDIDNIPGQIDEKISAFENKLLEENGRNIKIRNPLTGVYITIQDMFDILAGFHIPGAITVQLLKERNIPVLDLYNLNITVDDLHFRGNTAVPEKEANTNAEN